MEISSSTDSSKECTLNNLTDNQKRWCTYGLALNRVVIPAIRPVLGEEILKEYNDLVSSCGIDVQTKHNFPTPKYPTSMKYIYKNINGNNKKPFDYKVTSYIDFSKLFLKDFMAKLSAFDETCDASAVLTLLERIPIFPADVQNAAKDVRVDRNAWGHCNFTEWDDSKFRKRFDSMEKLVGEVDPADKSKVVADLNDWKERGVTRCMNATIDPKSEKTIQERVSKLSSDVEEIAVESKEEMDNLRELDNAIENIVKRFEKMEQKVGELQVNHEAVEQRVADLEECSSIGQNKRRDIVLGYLCSCMSMDGGDIIFRLASNIVRLCKDPGFTSITLGELLDAAEIIDPTVFRTSVKNGFGGDRNDQKVEVKHGSILVVVHCCTDERYLAILADFESQRLKERLLEEFLLIGVEIEGMEVEIMSKEEVSKKKKAIKERNEIFVIIKEGNLNEVRLFVEFGVDVNTKIRQNMTMLHLASQFGSLDIVQYLVARGAKVTSEDDDCQETVLHSACRGGNKEIVEYLLQHGAEKDINKKNHSGCSPLSIACSEGHTAIVGILRKFDIDLRKGYIGGKLLSESSHKMKSTLKTNSLKRSKLTTLTENNKRWCVFGIALNHVVVPAIRPVLEQEILKEYNDLKLNHNIHVQTKHSFSSPKYPTDNAIKYENINGNDTKLKAKFDCKVTSHVEFAKLFLENYMAKLSAFDETCDASAVLTLLGRIPVFSAALQHTANVVREGRNTWAYCVFTEWDESNFKKSFEDMEKLLKEVGLSPADESNALAGLHDWKDKGVALCMNASIDSELVKVMQKHVSKLSSDVNKMAFESQEELCNLKEILENTHENLQNCEKRVKYMELTQDTMEHELSSTIDKVEQLETNQEVLQKEESPISARIDLREAGHEAIQQRVTKIEGRQNISYGFFDCTSYIEYFSGRYDPDTRHWLLQDFNKWFSDSGNSRAYVLLGDAGVGKSVMAAVVAQRAQKDGNMAAAYFCRHYDGTRRDPRYLLGSIAYQLCNCNSQYDKVVGGESGIQNMLTNAKLGVHEIFTKLLEEPLSKCSPIPKKLVVIDALDEAEYLSRKDFLDLIMNRFPMLPEWLVFFITSRPEDIVHFKLQTYHPCIRICAGNSESAGFYEQHKQDIQRFLENKINFVGLPYTAEQLTEKCNGMFLYAFYIAEHPDQIKDAADIFPDSINEFFYKNFKRVKEKIGKNIYRKLFGCALAAPSPLPVSFISFLLKRENNALNEQEVIDAVSLFVALRTSDETFAFLHGLIPSWLTDVHKASRELFIDKVLSSKYFTKIIVEFLHSFLEEQQNDPSFDETSPDVVTYILVIGFRLLYQSGTDVSVNSEIVFKCLTNYYFLKQRLESNKLGIYSLLEDLELSVANMAFDQEKKAILDNIASVLREDKYIVLGSSELLASCLQKASQLTQANIRPPNVLARSGIIQAQSCNAFDHAISVRNILCDMEFCTLSHNKSFLAGGKERYIFLYDSGSFQKIFGPIEVVIESNQGISHLEFSPDDKFIFFGRLDRWLSVEEERVVEKTQFKANSKCYEWGSFISDGQYIAVSGQIPKHPVCLRHMLSRWAIKELALCGDRERWLGYTQELRHEILSTFAESHKNCENYKDLDNPEMDIRERISFYYADIFERQIWNVETGRPVLEEMFSSQMKSMPFFYIWHIFSAMPVEYIILLAEDIALHDIAIFALPITGMGDAIIDCLCISEEPERIHTLPVECFGNSYSSTNGKQLAIVSNSKFKLFEEINESVIKSRPGEFIERKLVDNLAFIHEDYIIYVSGQKLFAVSLQTGEEIESTSRIVPLRCSFEHDHHSEFRYIFRGFNNETKVVLLQNLPGEFLRNWQFRNYTKPIQSDKVTFTSFDSIIFLFDDGLCLSYNLTDKDMIQDDIRYLIKNEHSTEDLVKKCTFSHSGKIIAMHQGSELILFKGGEFLCSVFNVEEECEHSFPCLTFSTDDSLLLFCIKKGDDEIYDQSFYVWDVTNRVLSDPISLPYTTMHIESVCFSSDITKLFLCNALSVLVLEYPPNSSFNFVHVPNVHRIAYRECNYCTISSDNKLLACCIGNEILIHPVNGPNSFWNVPNNHTGRIEYCKFLRENRYLISYGVDGVVFLFDLSVWKSIAYVSQESIISMAMSPDEDKIVSLRASGEIKMVKLFGLKSGLPPNFKLPSDFRVQANSEKQDCKVLPQNFPSSLEEDYFIDTTFSDHSNSSTSSDEDKSG